ncbi:hypothetical protein E2C01_097303 [Portunus trituberculatus]|uniref:Uncharacterized protein n=1 Tax=Portunus trituberculatus TaxID=210409 RepID=A0A5B7K452_PORTR|nr:hypothetical protein [Portunus trituberculatus]
MDKLEVVMGCTMASLSPASRGKNDSSHDWRGAKYSRMGSTSNVLLLPPVSRCSASVHGRDLPKDNTSLYEGRGRS